MIKYPSIEQFYQFKKNANCLFSNNDIITLRGTVKLHGTHADIVYNESNGDIQFQSRNNILNETFDNMGFYNTMKQKSINKLFELVKSNSNYGVTNTEYSGFEKDNVIITICGEFCGGNIQKGVALSQLNKCFVIFDIRIGDDVWLDCELYKNVCLEDEGIYNIYNYKLIVIKTNLDELNSGKLQKQLYEYTQNVEDECPFSKSFGISGVGEGLVWKCLEYPSSKNWFKTKGEKHATSHVKTLKQVTPEQIENMHKIDCFSKAILTDARLNQGLDYLTEMNYDKSDIKNIYHFNKWILADIKKEESDSITEYGIDEKTLFKKISSMSLQFYKNQL